MSDPDIERLKLAFAYYLSEQVVDADGQVHPLESEFLQAHFPKAKLADLGLIDDEGHWTTVFSATVEEALRVLPSRLSDEEKRALMTVLQEASRSDADESQEAENNVLIVAARLLGVDPGEWAGS